MADDYLAWARSIVAEHGHAVRYVGAGDDPSFAYTVGLFDRWGYELVVVGLTPGTACGVLNAAVASYPDGPPAGALVRRIIKAPYLVAVLDPVPGDDRFPPNLASAYAGTPVPYAQIVVPDANYRMPWHKAYAHPDAQPVLGTPPARH